MYAISVLVNNAYVTYLLQFKAMRVMLDVYTHTYMYKYINKT